MPSARLRGRDARRLRDVDCLPHPRPPPAAGGGLVPAVGNPAPVVARDRKHAAFRAAIEPLTREQVAHVIDDERGRRGRRGCSWWGWTAAAEPGGRLAGGGTTPMMAREPSTVQKRRAM